MPCHAPSALQHTLTLRRALLHHPQVTTQPVDQGSAQQKGRAQRRDQQETEIRAELREFDGWCVVDGCIADCANRGSLQLMIRLAVWCSAAIVWWCVTRRRCAPWLPQPRPHKDPLAQPSQQSVPFR